MQCLYTDTITSITTCIGLLFKDITFSPLFQNLIVLLDDSTFGDKEIVEIVIHFNDLLKNGGCDIHKISISGIP